MGGLSGLELLLVAALIALIVVSVVGNCLVCVAIFTDRRLRKLGNAFIVSLAIADLFVSCLVMTFALCNDLMNYWIFGEWFCDVWISFDIMCCTASILNLCAISLDRFIHIKDCLLYNQWMTRKVALSAVVIIWCISATVSFVPINLGWHKPNHFSSSNNSSNSNAQELLPIGSFNIQLGNGDGSSSSSSNNLDESERLLKPLEQLSSLLPIATPHKLNYLPLRPIENQSSPSASASSTATATATATATTSSSSSFHSSLRSLSSLAGATTLSGRPNKRLDFVTSDVGELDNDELRQLQPHSSGPVATTAATATTTTTATATAVARDSQLGLLRLPRQFNKVESNPPDGSQIGPEPPPVAPPPGQHTSGWQDVPAESSSSSSSKRGDKGDKLPLCMLSLTPSYAVISSTISFYIPCIIMLGLYTKLFACARRHVRNIQALGKAPAPLLAVSQVSSSSPSCADALATVAAAAATVTIDSGSAGQQSSSGLRTWLKLAVNNSSSTATASRSSSSPRPTSQANVDIPAQSSHLASSCLQADAQQTARQRTSSKRPDEQQQQQQQDKWQARRLIGATNRLLLSDSAVTTEEASCPVATEEEQRPFLAASDTGKLLVGHHQHQVPDLSDATKPLSRQPTSASQRSTKTNQSQVSIQLLQRQQQQQQQQQQQSGQLATHKAAITLGIIMGTFLFCWVPFFCLNIIKAFCNDCIPSSLFRAFTWLGYANSALNPIIYGIHNSEFRCAFNRIFFKHLNIKNSRYYLNRRFSYDMRHQANLERRAAANRKIQSQTYNSNNNNNNKNTQNISNNNNNNAVDDDSKQTCNKSDTVT